jgi:hypothetical protein
MAPQKAVAKNYHSVPLPQAPDALELDQIEWGTRLNGPKMESTSRPGSGWQTPQTPNDLEMSRPPSPRNQEQDGVDVTQRFSDPPMNRFRMTSVSLLNFANGLTDSAPGALIPYMEKCVQQFQSKEVQLLILLQELRHWIRSGVSHFRHERPRIYCGCIFCRCLTGLAREVCIYSVYFYFI